MVSGVIINHGFVHGMAAIVFITPLSCNSQQGLNGFFPQHVLTPGLGCCISPYTIYAVCPYTHIIHPVSLLGVVIQDNMKDPSPNDSTKERKKGS
ncbi:hypothetical protein BDV26DRAFT_148939 [Aspergillus bertholletiae]|uniref:Uncharacterized protein n=1 Tax=Aspergillus bertholletiae TaxID=1226010 RepID=A0A5N7BEG5_9EURO|nr:hypothetical protein BDV26DRAFT_148939 [Aspergillus bertholletiae]